MHHTSLLTTTTLACLVLALGCESGTKASDPPRHGVEQAAIRTSPPIQQADSVEPVSEPRPAEPAPVMSAPPPNKALETPAPPPAPTAPGTPPSEYVDGCGRPLVT